MIEYAKAVLPKVSEWKKLFRKELLKIISWTSSDELDDLLSWCYIRFYDLHPAILDEILEMYFIKREQKITIRSLKPALNDRKSIYKEMAVA